jgi:CheY-like chemotaxis protein
MQSKKITALRFEVQDTGIGIKKSRQSAIFESFMQGDGSTTRNYGGTGLGTTISKQLVELMGGQIGIHSEQGKGSTFWFTVPFKTQFVQPELSEPAPNNINGYQVLLVDSNRNNAFILSQFFLNQSCTIHNAQTKGELENWINGNENSTKQVKVIILNEEIEGIHYFDAAKLIRRHARFDELPIILIKSNGQKGDGRTCREIGINGYFSAPYTHELFQRFLNKVFTLFPKPETKPVLVTIHTVAENQSRPIRILLVEDYPTNQQIALAHLKKAGHLVDLAENGLEAVDFFKKEGYDLILMDIQMPVMDGNEATRQIRVIEKTIKTSRSRTPIIAMTAHFGEGYKDECLAAGMDDIITKPLRRKGLYDTVNHWVHQKPAIS